MNKKQKKILYKNMGILFGLIVICAVLSRSGLLTGGETLEEHAQKQLTREETPAGSESNTVAPAPADNQSDNASQSEEKGDIPMDDRVTYQNGFYYESVNETVKKQITGISYPADSSGAQIQLEDLRYVRVLYYNFNDKEKTGELICNKAIAQDLVEIFYELYRNNYQIERIRLIDEYQGDDELSMRDNNTSCFNYRTTVSGKLSNHAYGLAVDINPFFNPYVTYNNDGSTNIYPAGSEYYADREKEFAYKIDRNDLAYQLFTEHGFSWGGNWNSCKDYQHFEKTIS